MPNKNGGCSPPVKAKIAQLREIFQSLINDPEIRENRNCAAEVKSTIAKNLNTINDMHHFPRLPNSQREKEYAERRRRMID